VAYRLAGKLSLGLAFGPTYFHARQANSVSAAPSGFDPHAGILAVGVDTLAWMALYFSIAVWGSLALVYAPKLWSVAADDRKIQTARP
jgi:hypothetical protein